MGNTGIQNSQSFPFLVANSFLNPTFFTVTLESFELTEDPELEPELAELERDFEGSISIKLKTRMSCSENDEIDSKNR